MSLINIIIPKIDKLKHFYLWTLLYFAVLFPCLLLSMWFISVDIAFVLSLSIVVVTAAWKEWIIDGLQGKGKREVLDFVFSILSPLLFTLSYFIVSLINN